MPIRMILKMRRLMYLWHLNNVDESSLIQRCYNAQRNNPVKKDWIHAIDSDMKELNIEITDEELKTISKVNFKKIIKKAAIKRTITYLNNLKKKHSKMDDIIYERLEQQGYLNDERINTSQVKLLFKLRTRMFECKQNFKNKHKKENLFCNLCKISIDSQSHLMDCFVLRNCNKELKNNKKVKYEHIFDSTELQIKAIQLLSEVVKTRELLLEKLSNEVD